MGDPTAVLVVSADDAYLDEFVTALEGRERIRVLTASSVDAAVATLAAHGVSDGDSNGIDCVVSDYDLPDSNGVRFLQVVRAAAPTLPFVLFTTDGTEEIASDAIAADVTDYLIKERFGNQWDRLASLVRDAVAYRRGREDLVDRTTRTEAVLNAIPDGVIVAIDDLVVFANENARTLLDPEGERAVPRAFGDRGSPVSEWLRPRETGSIEAVVERIRAGDRAFDEVTLDLFSPDRGYVPVDVTVARADWRDEGAIVYVFADVSDRQRLEHELAVKSRAMDDAPIGITLADADADDLPLVYANDRFEELTGYDRSTILGHNCRFLQGEDTAEEPVQAIREAIAARESVTVELRNYRADGSEFWNRLTVAPIHDENDEVTHFVGFQEDVTAWVDARHDRRRLERAVEAAGQAIFTTTADGTVTYANPAFEEITGHDADEVIGETPRILQSGRHNEAYYARMWETVLSGETWTEEVVNSHANGGTYHAIQTITPVFDGDGSVEELVAIQTDVTVQKEHERHLATLDRVLRHDLRNRLNVVMGHTEAIQEAAVDDSTAEHADAISEAIDDLLAIADREREINRMLLERPQRVAVEIVPTLRAALGEARESHPDATLDFRVDCPTDTEAIATENVSDAITEVVEFLLDHAESSAPHVDVTVTATAERVTIRIADAEDPIPETDRDVLLDTEDIDALNHGTGLDLWFVYWVVRRSNGSLSFSDIDESGNAIVIELPR